MTEKCYENNICRKSLYEKQRYFGGNKRLNKSETNDYTILTHRDTNSQTKCKKELRTSSERLYERTTDSRMSYIWTNFLTAWWWYVLKIFFEIYSTFSNHTLKHCYLLPKWDYTKAQTYFKKVPKMFKQNNSKNIFQYQAKTV